MYDEDALYNDIVSTGRSVENAVKSSMSIAQTLKNLIEASTPNQGVSPLETTDTSFIFTGQSTDLRYFAEHKEMPVSLIERIPDENLKNAVKDEFNKALLSGKATMSKGKISITPLGKEFISSPQFRYAAAKDVASYQAPMTESMGFMLTGTEQDLHIFNHVESFELSTIMQHPNKETVQKVLENIKNMRDKGLITIEKAAVKATAQGKQIATTAALQGTAKGTISKSAAMLAAPEAAIFIKVADIAVNAAKIVGNALK